MASSEVGACADYVIGPAAILRARLLFSAPSGARRVIVARSGRVHSRRGGCATRGAAHPGVDRHGGLRSCWRAGGTAALERLDELKADFRRRAQLASAAKSADRCDQQRTKTRRNVRKQPATAGHFPMYCARRKSVFDPAVDGGLAGCRVHVATLAQILALGCLSSILPEPPRSPPHRARPRPAAFGLAELGCRLRAKHHVASFFYSPSLLTAFPPAASINSWAWLAAEGWAGVP